MTDPEVILCAHRYIPGIIEAISSPSYVGKIELTPSHSGREVECSVAICDSEDIEWFWKYGYRSSDIGHGLWSLELPLFTNWKYSANERIEAAVFKSGLSFDFRTDGLAAGKVRKNEHAIAHVSEFINLNDWYGYHTSRVDDVYKRLAVFTDDVAGGAQ